MVFKKSFCLLLLCIVCACFTSFAFTQNANEQFIQLIEWDSVEYATHYIVVLEQNTAYNMWEQYDSFEITTNSLELILGAGDYRYNVTVYNVFGHAEQTSAWYTFTIEQALQPVVADIFPKELDLATEGAVEEKAIISVNPKDVSEQATFFLRRTEGNATLYGEFIGYDENGMMNIEFETEKLSSGDYELIIQDPSGLTSENLSTASVVRVEHYSPYYVHISAGFTFAFFLPLQNSLFYDFEFPSNNISANTTISYVPFVSPKLGSLGFELSAYMFYATFISWDTEVKGFLFPTTLNMVYHKQFGKKFVLATHFGVGATFFYNFMEHTRGIEMQNASAIAATAGIAGQYFIRENFFVELGADYIYSYLLNSPSFHTVLPSLSVGWKFD